jgi:hypothetical protein
MRIAHLSDLHFGHHEQAVADALAADLAAAEVDLLVVSGDFTQVGSEAEFATARGWLDALGLPFLAVPGNHDVPAINLFRRFGSPYGLYRRHISVDTEPFLEVKASPLPASTPLGACGSNSTGRTARSADASCANWKSASPPPARTPCGS